MSRRRHRHEVERSPATPAAAAATAAGLGNARLTNPVLEIIISAIITRVSGRETSGSEFFTRAEPTVTTMILFCSLSPQFNALCAHTPLEAKRKSVRLAIRPLVTMNIIQRDNYFPITLGPALEAASPSLSPSLGRCRGQ